jgi:very-short-patch-repair endonuclease
MQRRLHGGGVYRVTATDSAYKNARAFRRGLSLPEKLLWVRLRRAPVRFRRQHPIGPYVLDFYCAAAKLAIEVDGFAHDVGDRPERDETRTAWLETQGVEVVRVPATDVLKDPDAMADALLQMCAAKAEPLHHSAAPSGPPPRAFGAGRSA